MEKPLTKAAGPAARASAEGAGADAERLAARPARRAARAADGGAGRRDQLLAAAEELIVERELAALTVDDITGRAGVAKGTFYIYFSAKGELLTALRERYATAICAEQERALAELAVDDHAGRLERWVAEAIGGHLEHERLHDALFHHETRAADAIKTGIAPANPQLDLLAGLLGAGVAAGAFTCDDVETTAALLYGAMHAAVDLLLGRGDAPVDLARVVTATQLFARGAVGAA